MQIGIGMLGWGVVGSSVHRLLEEVSHDIRRRLGSTLKIVAVAVREPNKKRQYPIPDGLLRASPLQVVRDSKVRIVVELMGGLEPARKAITESIVLKKPVVTANKALLADMSGALFELCDLHETEIAFEAAVGGAVPIVRTLRLSLASDRIEGLTGIVNGTTNYVLEQMECGQSLDAAIREAQAAGFAEADPSLDLHGVDAAQKLALLSELAFGAPLQWRDVPTTGIQSLGPADLSYAAELGFRIKLLARANRLRIPRRLMARVSPYLVPRGSVLASIGGASNAVLLESHAAGPSLLAGRGAGGPATATAVISDLIDVARRHAANTAGLGCYLWASAPLPLASLDEEEERAYLRFAVRDRPGVLGRLATILGQSDVSIASMVQHGRKNEPVDVVLITHAALHRDIRTALEQIEREECVMGHPQWIPLLEPGPIRSG